MHEKASSSAHYFMGVLAYIVAWWIAPGPADIVDGNVLAAIVFAFSGFSLMKKGTQTALHHPSPFASQALSALWRIRPRTWVITWALVIAAFWHFGKPHVLFQYRATGFSPTCVYLNWNGFVRLRSDGDGHFNGCRLFVMR